MDIVPFVHEGLGNSSYLVELSNGEALLIDPDRTAGRYLRAAEERGSRISAVFETHVHADFITGALELAASGAEIHQSNTAGIRYDHRPVSPGQRISLSGVEIEVIGSPGHAPEHVSYVLRTANAAAPPVLFSGGALTAGGAARTDLVSSEMTESLTRATFRTVREAYAHLPDETPLYPTHGGGSFCSSGSTKERTSTLGRERETNPLLQVSDEEEFVEWFPQTFPAIPAYFSRMRPANQGGPRLRHDIPMPRALAPDEFQRAAAQGLVVDVRPVEEYLLGHIRGSLSNFFRPSYATWLGWLAPAGARLFFVLGAVPLDAVIDESLLVGYEEFGGYLEGGVAEWEKRGLPLEHVPLLEPPAARDAIADGAAILDVREPDEFQSGHIEGAVNVPLGSLEKNIDKVPRGRPIVTYCRIGERSTSAVSILERAGIGDLLNVKGGIVGWRQQGMPVRV
jgi:rhodanese-related sulfurtransferase/glyoxylase-like metal-dependent hydrolase (beta-lactamase superfamily II)